ncbi:MAG TPA: NYN domain-containing protein [Vicinamibacterales bacterium]|nr:NYN domain-containing protein [Vicinamibacterales bacterium]
MTQTDRLRLAVFIDFDNIEIGVKNTLGASFDAGLVLEALKERGEVVAKTAYSDWQRAGGYSRMLTQHAIRMVQRNMTPGGDKNGADINLALDALEMAFTHPHINAFVIVGGDSDFISLVEKLKQYDKKVMVVGGRQFTSAIMQRNCHEFIAYENLIGSSGAAAGAGAAARRETGRARRPERTAIEIDQAIPLITRALKVLSEREVSPQLGLLKSTLLQLDSTFSERSYGASSFRDFVQRLERAGLVRVHQGKGGLLVEAAEGAVPTDAGPADAVATSDDEPGAAPSGATSNGHTARPNGAIAQAGAPADGVRELRRILESTHIRRWPMYLRNVKQLLRQPATRLDERAYGFGNLVDLLRAAQKEGLLRVDRDRQGVIRVFRGADAPPSQAVEAPPLALPDLHDDSESPDDNIGNVAPDPAIPKARRRRGGVTPEVARAARGRRSRQKP